MGHAEERTKKLAKVILDNKDNGLVATIDNDCWWIEDRDGKRIATSKEYGDSGHGRAILEALAYAMEITLEDA